MLRNLAVFLKCATPPPPTPTPPDPPPPSLPARRRPKRRAFRERKQTPALELHRVENGLFDNLALGTGRQTGYPPTMTRKTSQRLVGFRGWVKTGVCHLCIEAGQRGNRLSPVFCGACFVTVGAFGYVAVGKRWSGGPRC